MVDRISVVPLNQTQKNILCVANKFHKSYLDKISPLFDESLKNFDGSVYSRKTQMLIFLNKNLEIHYQAVKYLTMHGFGEQGLGLCRTMFEIWFDSEYIRFTEDPNIGEKFLKWSRLNGFLKIQNQKKEDPEWVRAIKENLSQMLEAENRSLKDFEKEMVDLKNQLYNKKTPSHWTGISEKERWKSIKKKSMEVIRNLKVGDRYVYPIGSDLIHGTDFTSPPQYPSSEDSITTALAGGFWCFLGQTESLHDFLDLGLDGLWKEFNKAINELEQSGDLEKCPV